MSDMFTNDVFTDDVDSPEITTVLTLWYVTAGNPAEVLLTEPKADRGFGRKFLSQINPRWPITLIGQFPLNRSAPTSSHEFYIAGFPGITVVQFRYTGSPKLSELDQRWLRGVPVPASRVFAFAIDPDSDYGGFATFVDGEVERSLCARRRALYEDKGLPLGFESPYWAGTTTEQLGGISLPFEPRDIVAGAQQALLGVEISPDGPDINIVAYAVDGRPEPKVVQAASHGLRFGTSNGRDRTDSAVDPSGSQMGYDDYENSSGDPDDVSPTATAEELGKLARQGFRVARLLARDASRWAAQKTALVKERLRHTDRPGRPPRQLPERTSKESPEGTSTADAETAGS